MNFKEAIKCMKNGHIVENIRTHCLYRVISGRIYMNYNNVEIKSPFEMLNLELIDTVEHLVNAEYHTVCIEYMSFETMLKYMCVNYCVDNVNPTMIIATREKWVAEDETHEANKFVCVRDSHNGLGKQLWFMDRRKSLHSVEYNPSVNDLLAKDWYEV